MNDWLWTLGHTLWQALLVAILLYWALRRLSIQKTSLRYGLALGAMLMVVILGLETLAVMRLEGLEASASSPLRPAKAAHETTTMESKPASPSLPPSTVVSSTPGAVPVSWRSILFIGWLLGVTVMLMRILVQLAGAGRVTKGCRPVTEPHLLQLLDRLMHMLGITRRVTAVTGESVMTPAVIGCWRPMILLPCSLLTAVPQEDLEAILLHELAHIKRYDYLINFFQMVVEALLFFNPALWWISHQIRLEREACCDAVAVQHSGQRLRYAEILMQWAQPVQARSPLAGAALALSNRKESPLVERIRRVALPGQRSSVRFSGLGMVSLFVICGLVLAALWKTTDTAVVLAARMLTPAQRIQKMAELEATYGQKIVDPADDDYRVPDDQKALLSGTIETWDHQPLPRDCKLKAAIITPQIHSLHDVGISKDGTFQFKGAGQVYFAVYSSVYAPAFLGPVTVEPNVPRRDLTLVLRPREQAWIRIVDAAQGTPVQDVNLTGGYLYYPDGYSYTLKLTTDANGIAELPYSDQVHVSLKAEVPGYEEALFRDITLTRGSPVVLKMSRAEPATGVVVTPNGSSVPHALIRIQGVIGYTNTTYGDGQGPILAKTDESGRFILTTLRQDTVYYLAVTAPEQGYALINQVHAGQRNLKVTLASTPVIHGKVIGPLARLDRKDGKPVLDYWCDFDIRAQDGQGTAYSQSGPYQSVPVIIDGNSATFELTHLWGNVLHINHQRIDLEKPWPDPLVVNLSDPLASDGRPYDQREVEIQFNVPKGYPPPTGTIHLSYSDPNRPDVMGNYKILPIVDGKVIYQVYAPGQLSVDLADTIGYWFKERMGVKVSRGSKPFPLTLDAIPAGAIYGRVLDHNGSDTGNVMVSVQVVEKSPLLGRNAPFLNVDGKNTASDAELKTTFNVTPLPLGGRYALVAHRNNLCVESEPITLNEEAPIVEQNLILPEGHPLSGRVIDVQGNPVRDIPFQLDYDSKCGGGFTRSPEKTGPDGTFSFGLINPDAPGTYILILDCRRDYRKVSRKITDFSSPLTVKLERGAVATGRILDDKTGWPIPGGEVSAWYSGNSEYEQLKSEQVTDQAGRFRFSNMKAGRTYTIHVSDCRMAGDEGQKVTADQTQALTLRVTPYDWSRLKPRKPE